MATIGDVIAANVRGERARRRWDQAQLGAMLGWSRGTVSDLESGRRKVTAADLPGLCRAFGISLARLLDGAEDSDIADLRL